MRGASCWQHRVWWCWDKQQTTACCFRLPLLNDIFSQAQLLHSVADQTFCLLVPTKQNRTLASMYKCKRRSHASVRGYFKLNYANKQPAIAGWHRGKGRDDWVLVLWHEKTAIFLKWLLPSAMPLPNPVFFVFSPSLCLYCELICSQRGNLNCNLKAFLNNFDSLKVAH